MSSSTVKHGVYTFIKVSAEECVSRVCVKCKTRQKVSPIRAGIACSRCGNSDSLDLGLEFFLRVYLCNGQTSTKALVFDRVAAELFGASALQVLALLFLRPEAAKSLSSCIEGQLFSCSLKSNPGIGGDPVLTNAIPLAPSESFVTMMQGAFMLGTCPIFPFPNKGDKGFEIVLAVMFRGGTRDEAEVELLDARSSLARH